MKLYVFGGIFILIIFIITITSNFYTSGKKTADFDSFKEKIEKMPQAGFRYFPTFDTIYVLGSSYIHLSLKEQKVRLFRRNIPPMEFKISSGNGNIPKGISTPTGLFTVQSKNPKAISKQFNNAEMFFWVGFNGNIGFHGLKGNGYYASLGKKASSHGCVRIAREDGEILFNYVTVGTPVLVYEDFPARIIKFSNYNNFDPAKDIIIDRKSKFFTALMNKRLLSYYSGKANLINYGKIFLDGESVLKPGGFDIGERNKIAVSQEINIENLIYQPASQDNVKTGMNSSYFQDSLTTVQ